MPKIAPYHRRIDAGILAGMIVPPPALELDAGAADEPLSRERRLLATSRLSRHEPDEERDEQQRRELERMLRDHHR